MRVSVHTNMKLFQTGMIRLIGTVEAGSEEGIWEALQRFLSNCLNSPPACPSKTGWLRDHHEIDVQKTATGVKGILRVVDTPYAASLHEGISRWGTPYRKWTTPGTGSHWISSKMLAYSTEYIQKIATTLRRAVQVKGYLRKAPFGLGASAWVKSFTRMVK